MVVFKKIANRNGETGNFYWSKELFCTLPIVKFLIFLLIQLF